MPDDEREVRIAIILKRAEKLARADGFAVDKASWLRMRPRVKEKLTPLYLTELEEAEWTDDDIKSILDDIKRSPQSTEAWSSEGIQDSGLLFSGFPGT